MRVVITCAAKKRPAASFVMPDGRTVLFVTRPELAPESPDLVYARPDDPSDDGQTWRQRLLAYNRENEGNPLAFLPAFRLYSDDIYRDLVDRIGLDRVFILSAGWGLIPANFLTPRYDITFKADADLWKRRRKGELYQDYCLMPDDGNEVVFLGGKGYRSLFCQLTRSFRSHKHVVFRSVQEPDLPPGFTATRYQTRRRTNWHYEAVRALMAGRISF